MSKAPKQRIDIVNLITNFSGPDNNIVIPRPFLVWCGGDLAIALFLSECLYWSDKTKDPHGWFARTAEEWQKATTLSRDSIDRAYVTLIPLGLGREVRRSQWHDFVPVLHYRFNQEALREAANNFFSDNVPLAIPSFKDTREVLKEESAKRKAEKSETALRVEHKPDSVSNTNGNLRVEHESYKENSREYEENIEKEIAPAIANAPAPSQSSAPTPSSSVLAGENTPATAPTTAQGKSRAKDKSAPLIAPVPPTPKVNGAAALAAALNVTIAGDDGAFYGALAKKLLKGITCEDFPAYVSFVKDMAAREKWNFTPASLTGVGRLSLFVTWQEEQAAKAERRRAMEEKVYAAHPYLDPANKPDPSTYIQGDVKDAYLAKLNSFLGGQK